jgi:phosphonate degradation associated HDIG domain protein
MTKQVASSVCEKTLALLRDGGDSNYFGERVTQLQHALQAGHLARSDGADDETVLAALLHDIGHLLEGDRDDEVGAIDHEKAGVEWLANHGFGERLIELVGSHVNAKRYLVATRPDYRNRLSEASQRTLALQGGPMTTDEAKAFETSPRFPELLRVRNWDEQAKDPDALVPPLDSYHSMLFAYLERQEDARPLEGA